MLSEKDWTAQERCNVFLKYLEEAAEESLGKVYLGGRNQANKPRRNGWWDEEVKEAILRRKEACRQHRKYNLLREAFPEVISREKVEEKWMAYLQMKQVSKDLVAKKRLQERDEVLREFRNSGGYGSSYFWKKVKKGGCQGSEDR